MQIDSGPSSDGTPIRERALNMKTSLILFFSIFLAANISAQEIGISPVIIWTHNYEIQNPLGVGGSLSKDIWKMKLKVEYIFAKNERSYDGYMTYGFLMAPSPNSLEHINSTSSFTAYEFSINIPQAVYAEYCLTFGLGLTFDRFTATRKGLTSGKMVTFEDETKSGPFLLSQFRGSIFCGSQ